MIRTKRLKGLAAVLVGAVMMLMSASCEQSREDMLVGKWKMVHVSQQETTPEGDTLQDVLGYENYHMDFARDGLCMITDRGVNYVYEWYMVDDYHFILVDYLKVQQAFYIKQLERKSLVYTYAYDYARATDSTTVSVIQTFELKKE